MNETNGLESVLNQSNYQDGHGRMAQNAQIIDSIGASQPIPLSATTQNQTQQPHLDTNFLADEDTLSAPNYNDTVANATFVDSTELYKQLVRVDNLWLNILIAVYGITLICSLSLNLFTLIVLYCSPRKRVLKEFLINLSITDVLSTTSSTGESNRSYQSRCVRSATRKKLII